MVLIVDGINVPADCDPLERILQSERLQEGASSYAAAGPVKISPKRAVYVPQREYAICLPKYVDFVGSTAATTCCIFGLRDSDTGKVLLSHDDGSQKNVSDLLQQLTADPTKPLELYIVGGYCDLDGTSKKVLDDLLQALHAASNLIDVKLACVYSFNDLTESMECRKVLRGGRDLIDDGKRPKVTSLAIDIKRCIAVQCLFEDKGPMTTFRGCRAFSGSNDVVSFYRSEEDRYEIFYEYEPVDDQTIWALLQFTDDAILSYTSTSPFAEAADFPDHCRESMRFMAEHRTKSSVFPKNEPLLFARDQQTGYFRETAMS